MKRLKELIKTQYINRVRNSVFSLNQKLGRYEDIVWLIGDGRSGTTWISSLINHDKRYREMFEPFHPKRFSELGFQLPHLYLRPNGENASLYKIANRIFSGHYTEQQVDKGNRRLLYNGLLIKDIFANLFAYWAFLKFSGIKVVLLIRNPFSCAISKFKKKKAFWVKDPMALLNQSALLEDYLRPFENMIKKISHSDDFILKQVLIWSIINYVPLRQFQPNDLHVVFYEDVYCRPGDEIKAIFQFIKGDDNSVDLEIPLKIISTPSRMTGESGALLSGKSPVSSWKEEVTACQIDSGIEILHHFGFDELYNKDSMPDKSVISRIQKM